MADTEKTPNYTGDTEKNPAYTGTSSPNSDRHYGNREQEQRTGWIYRTRKIGPLKLPPYASPPSQLLIVSFVCFLCPGMFNALTGMGGGGQVDTGASNDANTALYAVFAVVGFFAGTFTNWLGIKLALSIGGLGYCLYVASFLSYSHTQSRAFVVAAGAILGLCAGLLWCAQGAIMTSYPDEKSKGKYIAWFWMIFNMGAVIGSLIPLGQNINATGSTAVSDGTYVGFLVLTFLGACLAWTLCKAKNVVRADGSKVILMKHPTAKSEILGMWQTFWREPYIVLLFPMFFSSNWFYTYQFQDFNHARFDTRTQALNNTLYWVSQIVGAFAFGFALDIQKVSRPTRARIAWGVLFTLTMAIWGGGYVFQKGVTRETVDAGEGIYDWTTSGYVGPMFLYMFYGFYDAVWQTTVYWYLGALTNNGRSLANYAGWYKGIQSAGASVVYHLDAIKTPYISMFASSWGLLAGSLVVALPLILLKIKDSVTIEEDLVLSDETYEEVAPIALGGGAAPNEKS